MKELKFPKNKKNDFFEGVSIIVTTEPLFIEAKAAPNTTAIDVLNAYGTVTETVKNLLLKLGLDENVVNSSMDYAHNQAMQGIIKNDGIGIDLSEKS